jgi:membrane protease YdiL (CAAX protease family)
LRPAFADSRSLSAVEFAVGVLVVIGHNVFRILPNEVPILCVLGLISFRVRNGGWAAMGFRRPASWTRIVLIAVAAAVLRIVLGELVVDPLTARYWPPAASPAGVEAITGNLAVAAMWLLKVWTFAAFGEEIAYRGYLLNRAADVGRRSTAACWIAMVLVSIAFGYGHYYKGPAGILDSGVAGLVLGTAYLLSGRNLWASIIGHGLIDTVGIVVLFLGLQ